MKALFGAIDRSIELVVAGIFSGMVAVGSWWLVEKPVLARRHKLKSLEEWYLKKYSLLRLSARAGRYLAFRRLLNIIWQEYRGGEHWPVRSGNCLIPRRCSTSAASNRTR